MQSHFQYENPFNVLALFISKLPQVDEELYRSKDKRDVLLETEDWDNRVFSLLSELDDFNDIDSLLRDGITQESLVCLQKWHEDNPGFSPMLSLICGLDHILRWDNILKSAYMKVTLKDCFDALNDNVEETGILILPRVPSLNEPLDRAEVKSGTPQKTWAYNWEPGINEELTNTYYIEKNELTVNGTTYRVTHRIMRDWLVGNPILLAVSPISKNAQLFEPICYESGGKKRFAIKGVENPELIRRRVKAAYKKAAEIGVNLLIYPEMLGDESMFTPAEGFSDFFSQLGDEVTEAGYSSPALVLPPTLWHNKHNKLYVIGGDGGYVCVQEKQNPFLYCGDAVQEKYLEDLRGVAPIIQVIHVPYVGRLTFPICKDYLVPEYRELLVRTLRSTMMLCPSYSKGKFSFSVSAPAELAYGCYSLWINTCAALSGKNSPPPYIGLFATPNTELVHKFEPKCRGLCGLADDACLFIVEIKRTGMAPEIIIREHIHPALMEQQ